MKQSNTYQALKGFTLVELITVMGIIAVLATISITAFGVIQKKTKIDETRVFLKDLERALEDYKLTELTYPVSTTPAERNGDEESSVILYEELSGFLRGAEQPTEDNYHRELRPGNTRRVNSEFEIIDAFKQPVRYRSAIDDQGNPNQACLNPEFDLWSAGPDVRTNVNDHKAKESLDDIGNRN